MKKIKLFLAAVAAMVGLSAQAQSWTAPTIQGEDPVNGTQYKVMNVGAGTFLDMGKAWFSWSTTAILSNTGIDFTMTADGDNWKFFRTDAQGVFTSGNGISGDAMHVDNTPNTYGITKLANGYYHIHDAGGDASSLCWGYNSSFHATGVVAHADATVAGWNCEWVFIQPANVETVANLYNARLSLYNEYLKANALGVNTDDAATVYNNASATVAELNTATTNLFKARRDYYISIATADAPQDLTEFYVVNPDFATLDGTGWTRTQTSVGNQQFSTGAMESWNNNNVSVLQDLTDLPNGRFRVSCDMIAGNDLRTAYVYAKGMTEVEGEHVEAQSSAADYTTMSNEVAGNTISAYPVVVGDHTMTIGFKDPSGWVVVDNFKVLYYGPDLSALKEALQSLIDGVAALEGTTTTAAYNAAKDYADGINVEGLNTEEAITTASSELSALVDAAKALQANYARYNAIKTSATTIATSLDTTNPDDAFDAATTNEAIDAAIVTLRAAFLAELPNVTVSETGLDVTAVMVDNASVSVNTDYWTAEGTPNTSYSWAVCNYGECEFYQQNFKFYQTLALTPGTWEFGVTGFHRAGNHSTYFYAGNDDKILIPGVESSVVNTMAAAKTYFDNGNGKVALKFLVEEAGNIEIGIDNQDTETDKWTIFRDFTLKYFGAPDYSVYDEQLAAAVAAAKAVEGNVPAAVYATLDGVVTENNKTYTKKAEYLAAIEAIENATATAKAVESAYAAYKLDKAAAEALAAVANDNEEANGVLVAAISSAATDAEDATTIEAINTAEAALKAAMTTYVFAANPVGDGAKFDCTFLLTNPDVSSFPAWTKREDVPGWYTDMEDGNSQTMTNDAATSEDGTKTHFFEYWSNPAKANDAFALYQKVTLPVGTFDINCYAFAQDQYAGTNSVGVYFYANDTQGSAVTTARLTQAGISFVNATEQEVKIGLKTIAGNSYNWMGIGYVELYKVPAKVVTIDENVDYTPQSAAGTVTLTRTIKADTWNTFVVPFAISNDELKAAFGEDVAVSEFSENSEDPNAVTVNFNNMTTPAITPNKPVLLKTSTAGTSYTFEGRTIAAGEAIAAGKNFDFVGTYAASTSVAEGDYFISANKLYKSTGATTVKGTRAYLKSKGEVTGEVKLFIEGEDGIVTAIDSIDGESVVNGAIFNLAGQRVQKAQKGVYIIGGKKVAVK